MTTDKSRINKFIELLPERRIDGFLNYSLYNARYTQEEINFINKYLDDYDKIFFQFNDDSLNKLKEIFDSSFKELMNFVVNSFFIIQAGVYVLYPDLKNSLDTKEQNAWHKKLNEVNKLSDIVWDNYKNLLKEMKKYLEKSEQKKSVATIINNIKNSNGNVSVNSPNSQQSIVITKNDLTPEILEILKQLQEAVDAKDEKKIDTLLKELKVGAKNIFWGVITNGLSAVLKINEISN